MATFEKTKEAVAEIKTSVDNNTYEIKSSNAKIGAIQHKIDENANNIESMMIEIETNETNQEDSEIIAQLKDSFSGNQNSN